MINIEKVDIFSIDDYENLRTKVNEEYLHKKFIEELKSRVGLKVNKILIEYPYYDKDYLSTYYLFYSKKLRNFDKAGYRIHFLKDDTYLGYLTLRPTVNYTKIGKSYIHPSLTLLNPAYILTSDFKVHILGERISIDSYPWMYQETDISVCAHVAIWNISRYYGNKYKNHKDVTMGNITDYTNEFIGRKIPSEGLNLIQMSEILSKLGFSPLLVQKISGKEKDFLEETYSYIESGIPCIGIMTNREHAVSLIGHGEFTQNIPSVKGICSSFDLIDSLIIVDDNMFPFIEVYKDGKSNGITQYSLDDFDYILVPLYERMQYGYRMVKHYFELLFSSKSYQFPDDCIVRIYLTSSNSFKREISKSDNVDIMLKRTILSIEMSKFIWCVDISTQSEYLNKKISGRIIIDSTCCSNETSPSILIHDTEKIGFNDKGKWNIIETPITPYDIYMNNLRRYEP